MSRKDQLAAFVSWWQHYCRGDEKGEAQVFLDRLFQAFGHAGALEAGGQYESRVRRHSYEGPPTVAFADYLLPGKVLIEMKKRGEDLRKHYDQLERYWKNLEGRKPQYALLCNFDDIWIYEFPTQFYDPVDYVPIEALPERAAALEFLVPGSTLLPVFKNNQVEVTREAAHALSLVFKSLDRRGVERRVAQRFILQCMLALFAEDIGLLPNYDFTRVIDESMTSDESYDLIEQLFFKMNKPGVELRGRFRGVDYFDGGLFRVIEAVPLQTEELRLLREAANANWSKIRPAIFGTIFEDSMEKEERHQIGAHFTIELDIKRIVDPVIVEPWDARIEAAHTAADLYALHDELCAYQVLDPACGSGNFLYIAYREMKKLERRILDRLTDLEGAPPQIEQFVTARQFWGFDIKDFAVELARVTMMIAKKLAVDELHMAESPLPLDNLDANIRCTDALFEAWPDFDACIGNPPYMGAKVLKQEHSPEYINRVRDAFPGVPGNADYCVYWFRKAHDLLKPGARAGLVGTNTIRQNYTRIGGLDYIVANGGQIYDAVSSMPWSGEAAVHVSIACWSLGDPPVRRPPRLRFYDEKAATDEERWRVVELPTINSALSEKTDVSDALVLLVNVEPKRVFQGQIPGHEAFVLTPAEALEIIRRDRSSEKVIFPFLIGRDLIARPKGQPSRYVIDLEDYDVIGAQQFSLIFQHIKTNVLPVREAKAKEEAEENKRVFAANPKARTNHHHRMFLRQWWKHSYGRADMLAEIGRLSRYIVCSEVTKRPIFEFVSPQIRPDHTLIVFILEDDYSFGILQSSVHWQWFVVKCSTLGPTFRYTPHSVFDTFPWPQNPTHAQVQAVADAGRALHEYRRARMSNSVRLSLRDMYRSLELPGQNPLKDLHAALDSAVTAAYGFDPQADILAQILTLNVQVADRIEAGGVASNAVTAPGVPPDYPSPADLVSAGCIQPPELI